jgi:polygalacturonase
MEGQMSRPTPAMLIATVVVFGAVFSHARDPNGVVADGNETASPNVINVKSFGAIGDGVAMETKAIQDSIDACHDAGGGIVRVPANAVHEIHGGARP